MAIFLNQKLRRNQRLRLRALGAVFRTTLLAALHAHGVQRAAHDVITHTREVLDAAAADQHQRVLLQVVADARDVGRDFNLVGQADARDLAKRRIRLLRGLRKYTHADAAFLRAVLQCGALGLPLDPLASFTDQLTN